MNPLTERDRVPWRRAKNDNFLANALGRFILDQPYPYNEMMRRLIPYLLLSTMTVLAAGAALLSWHDSSAVRSTAIYDCSNQNLVTPSYFVLSCADANSALKNLHWTDWNQPTAYATGTATWNNCTPDCAGGKWLSAPVSVYAYRVRDGHYTRLNSHHSSLFRQGPFIAASYPPSN